MHSQRTEEGSPKDGRNNRPYPPQKVEDGLVLRTPWPTGHRWLWFWWG